MKISESFQGEFLRVRVNIKWEYLIGGVRKKFELPLRVQRVGDFGNSKAEDAFFGREKINVSKNDFNSLLADLISEVNITVKNTLANDDSEENVKVSFQNIWCPGCRHQKRKVREYQ